VASSHFASRNTSRNAEEPTKETRATKGKIVTTNNTNKCLFVKSITTIMIGV
jgi:hypothetical protein